MSKDITININEKLCKQCGICSALCPKQVLEQSYGSYPKVAHLDACIGCKLCALRCPDLQLKWRSNNG